MFEGLGMAHQLFKELHTKTQQSQTSKLGMILSSVRMVGWCLFLSLYLIVASCFSVVGIVFAPTIKVKELSQ